MRKFILFLVAILFFVCNFNFAYADQKIRVGLESQFKVAESAKIANKKIYLGFDEKFSDYPFEAKNNFIVSVNKKFYVSTNKKFDSYQNALSAKNNYVKDGYKSVVCAQKNAWSVYVGEFDNLDEAKKLNSIIGGSIICPQEKHLVIYDGDVSFIIFEDNSLCPQFKSDEFIKLNDREYRGIIEFGFYDTNKIMAVNILSLNEYLYGTVPSEMPASWPQEALKAQAVACRTYTLTKLKSHKYYDVCDLTHCQVYLGVKNESQTVNKLIHETKNICIYYNDKLIDAVFFSSSGGVTENAENVWSNSVEYLKSKVELNEQNPKIWTREFKSSQLKQLLAENKIDIGDVLGVEILEYAPSDRVNKISIIGTNGQKVLAKEEIRSFFAKSKGGSLESRMFTVTNKIPDSLDEDNSKNLDCTIIFQGRGWGHAVGMSQYGAKGMAQMGFKFDDILKYYYTGVQVK
jgi:SpoIID/LytB domain